MNSTPNKILRDKVDDPRFDQGSNQSQMYYKTR